MSKGGSRSGKDQKKKRINLLKKFANKLKIRKLQETNKRGRIVKKKKVLSNIPVQERSADVNKKARGLSNLGSDYKKQEEKLSKKATERSAQINKARYPEMGTYKGKGNTAKTTSETKKVSKKGTHVMKKFIRHNGKIISRNSRAGRELEKKLKIKKSK